MPADLRIASPWRQALPAVSLLWAALLLLYRDTAWAMVEIWSRSDTFAHGFLVLPISLWLVWRRRALLGGMEPRPQPWLLLPMAALAALWLLADLVSVNAAAQFALVGLLVLAVPAVLGLPVAKAILFPLLFLFFAVPFGEFLMPVLMEHTADFTVAALRLSGIPVYREGLQFVIPSGNWSVVEACSGVRYLIASFMVGTLFAYLNYRSTTRRLVFMAVSMIVPIVANWLRAYLIVMLGHHSGNTIAVGADHLVYGWVFFGVVIMLLYLVGARWAEPDAVAVPMSPRFGAQVLRAGTNSALVATLLAGVSIALLPHLAVWVLQRADASAAEPKLVLPEQLGAWRADGAQVVAWSPRFVNPSVEARQAYTDGSRHVGVYVAYFRGQGPDRKLVSSQNVLVTSQDRQWNQVSTGSRDVQAGNRNITVRTAELLGTPVPGAQQRPQLVVWKTYWVDGRLVAGDAAAKLSGAQAQMLQRGDDGAVVVLYADADTVAKSNEALAAFARLNLDKLGQLLQRTRDAR